MDALFTIATLCQISGSCPPKVIDQYQLKCQKELIECYTKKLSEQKPIIDSVPVVPFRNAVPNLDQDFVHRPRTTIFEDREWKGPLKDCVLERKL